LQLLDCLGDLIENLDQKTLVCFLTAFLLAEIGQGLSVKRNINCEDKSLATELSFKLKTVVHNGDYVGMLYVFEKFQVVSGFLDLLLIHEDDL
jgi:hypothetical protein